MEERRRRTAEDKSEDGGMKMEESGKRTEVGGWRIHVRT